MDERKEILGYECMTPDCGAVSPVLLDVCPLCHKKDWRAIVNREPVEVKKNPTFDDMFDEFGLIKEEYLIGEGEFTVTKPGVSKRKFQIKYSESSFQNDNTGGVARFRMIDRENVHYVEKVVYTDTGTIIRDCDEKLTEHLGHGSAKKDSD